MEFLFSLVGITFVLLAISRISKFGIIDREKSIGLQDSRKTPGWAREGVIYEVYVRNFSERGTFKELRERLPELKNLGVDIIWLMPIFPIGELGRKGKLGCPYSIRDYLEINPEYGSKDEFRQLVMQIHNMGMKIIIDMVANHSSNDHVEMKEHPEWFARDKNGEFTRKISDWSDVTDLNYNSHELREYMKQVILYWIKEFDIDGYRCDVAGMVPDDFWIDVRKAIEQVKPDVYLLAEWEDPEMHLASFDSTYDWTMYYKYLDVLHKKVPAEEIIDLLIERHQEFPKNALRLRFIENHDKKRAIPVFGLIPFKPFAAFIFLIDGIPLIYNGQEVGDDRYSTLFDKDKIEWRKSRWQEIRDFYKFLIQLRKENPVLIYGKLSKIDNDRQEKIVSFLRYNEYGNKAIAVINFSNNELRVKLNHSLEAGSECIHINTGKMRKFNVTLNSLTMKPYSAQLIKLNVT